jgi:hypothetical protein
MLKKLVKIYINLNMEEKDNFQLISTNNIAFVSSEKRIKPEKLKLLITMMKKSKNKL